MTSPGHFRHQALVSMTQICLLQSPSRDRTPVGWRWKVPVWLYQGSLMQGHLHHARRRTWSQHHLRCWCTWTPCQLCHRSSMTCNQVDSVVRAWEELTVLSMVQWTCSMEWRWPPDHQNQLTNWLRMRSTLSYTCPVLCDPSHSMAFWHYAL